MKLSFREERGGVCVCLALPERQVRMKANERSMGIAHGKTKRAGRLAAGSAADISRNLISLIRQP